MEDQKHSSLMEIDDEPTAPPTEHYLDSTSKQQAGADMDVVPEEDDGAEAEEGATPVKRLEAVFGSAKEDAPCLQVVVRVRPISKERDMCTEVISDCMIRTTVPENSVSFKLVGPQVKEYTFNRVFRPDCQQEEMYKGTTEPLVDALYMGRSGLLFAYGVTNAGKTFTIMGNEENPGILPRALGEIFSRLKRDEKTTLLAGRQCAVVASYLEVYNDQIFDLLDESGNRKALKPADRGGRIEVKGLSKREITDVQSGTNLVRQGAANRQKAATKLNIDSSRSHSVFTIELVSRPLPGPSGSSSSSSANGGGSTSTNPPTALSDDAGARPADIVGTLWIVDLAGSERSNRAGHSSGKLQREASGINTSLMKLWRCLDQLRKNQSGSADGQQLLVPFRECKITHLFMNHLTGASVGRTVMILNINPSKEDYDETAHVLNQGSGAQEIRVIKDFKREMRHRQLLGGTHDYDGRRILKRRKSADKAGSFRGTGSKAGPQPSIAEDDEEEDLSGVESDTALTTTGRKSIVIRHYRDVEQENLRMKGVEEENRLLRDTVESLKNRLCLAETQIREEVAEEMAQVMSSMEHELRVLREQSLSLSSSSSSSSAASRRHASSQREANPFANIGKEKEAQDGEAEQVGESCTSARKIYQGRLEKRVAELEDQKQEAEEEMRRMRQRHEEEVARLRTRIQELMEREEDRDSLDALPGMTLASLQEEADELKKELQQAKDDAEHWKAIAEGKSTAAPPAAAPPSGKAATTGAKSRKRSKSTEATTKAPPPADETAMMDVAPAPSSTEPPCPSTAPLPSPPEPPGSGSGSGPSAAADVMPPPAPRPQQPPPNPAASAKANDDRRLKIQERVRQQLKPKADGSCPQASPAGAGQEDGATGKATGALSKTPIAKRLRSRHPTGAQDDQQEPPTI